LTWANQKLQPSQSHGSNQGKPQLDWLNPGQVMTLEVDS